MILSRPTTICQKTTEGRYKYTRATQKPFHIFQHIQMYGSLSYSMSTIYNGQILTATFDKWKGGIAF